MWNTYCGLKDFFRKKTCSFLLMLLVLGSNVFTILFLSGVTFSWWKPFFLFLFFLLWNKNRSGPNGPIVSNLGNITFREGIFLCVQLDKLHFPIPDCTMWTDAIWKSVLFLNKTIFSTEYLTLTLNDAGFWSVKEAGGDQSVPISDNGLWWPQFSFKLHKQYPPRLGLIYYAWNIGALNGQ